MSQSRDQIITFLLQNDDNNQRIIADLQKRIAELEKAAADKTDPQT